MRNPSVVFMPVVAMPHWPRKEEFACCRAKVDADGRYPIGWCGPDCERRSVNTNTGSATKMGEPGELLAQSPGSWPTPQTGRRKQ